MYCSASWFQHWTRTIESIQDDAVASRISRESSLWILTNITGAIFSPMGPICGIRT
ncbi:hypothetical protein BCR43DRAFT_492785 [Syncephalastrum racemosum]|uniref:Uncharacterized protein n=1 Tax=Syncephalastrum racemosum TaxID=13706 RepID=A0A1X2H9H0_SYNRA|nr:hypothetical protein BCR43DRAFT_492785 [Syncephalastrum racemosum]